MEIIDISKPLDGMALSWFDALENYIKCSGPCKRIFHNTQFERKTHYCKSCYTERARNYSKLHYENNKERYMEIARKKYVPKKKKIETFVAEQLDSSSLEHKCADELCPMMGKVPTKQNFYCRDKDNCLHGRCPLSYAVAEGLHCGNCD
jgi:hypothetical protein